MQRIEPNLGSVEGGSNKGTFLIFIICLLAPFLFYLTEKNYLPLLRITLGASVLKMVQCALSLTLEGIANKVNNATPFQLEIKNSLCSKKSRFFTFMQSPLVAN